MFDEPHNPNDVAGWRRRLLRRSVPTLTPPAAATAPMRITSVCPPAALDPVVRYGIHPGVVIIELRVVPGCPNLEATREVLQTCLAEAGLAVAVVERIGESPSPSILVDGRDVTSSDPRGPAACVLRPPTSDQIRTALRAAISGTVTYPTAAPGSVRRR